MKGNYKMFPKGGFPLDSDAQQLLAKYIVPFIYNIKVIKWLFTHKLLFWGTSFCHRNYMYFDCQKYRAKDYQYPLW